MHLIHAHPIASLRGTILKCFRLNRNCLKLELQIALFLLKNTFDFLSLETIVCEFRYPDAKYAGNLIFYLFYVFLSLQKNTRRSQRPVKKFSSRKDPSEPRSAHPWLRQPRPSARNNPMRNFSTRPALQSVSTAMRIPSIIVVYSSSSSSRIALLYLHVPLQR